MNAKGKAFPIASSPIGGPAGQVFARFESVPFGDYTISAELRGTVGLAPEGRVQVPLAVTKAKINASSKQVEQNVTLKPVDRLTLSFIDPDTSKPVKLKTSDEVVLEPAPVALLDKDWLVYEITPGTAYSITFKAKRSLYFDTAHTSATTAAGPNAETIKLNKRKTVLYVIIDRPGKDEADSKHHINEGGLKAALSTSGGARGGRSASRPR